MKLQQSAIRCTGRNIELLAGRQALTAELQIPSAAGGAVLFCQVSGRHSSRARFVAEGLLRRGFATMLVDLLTRQEEAVDVQTGQYRLDIDLLAARILAATEWLSQQPETRSLPVGYYGVSVAAAAALAAACRARSSVGAIVCRGGRLDFCTPALGQVQAPTLLIVGSRDPWVLQVNTAALAGLKCRNKKLEVVPGAAHLFSEPDAIQAVTRLACDWFFTWLAPDAGLRHPG